MNPILQTIYAFFGTLGFCLYFHTRKEHLWYASLTGAASWAIYLLLRGQGAFLFSCAFASSLFAATASEVLARKRKAPSLIFYIAGIIPLVPGSTLYYMMEAIVNADYALAASKAADLGWTITGIGAGSALVIGLIESWKRYKKSIRK